MRIAVLGTGMVGQALAERLAELGHDVTIGTRDVAAALARTEGTPTLKEWVDAHPDVRLATLAEAAAGAELVVNATSGQTSLAALRAAGEQNLSGKVLLDIANPLDFSAGFPPTLTVKDTDSLGEQIQAAFPTARVVKSLNTLTAALMVHPELVGDGNHTVFVSGNDPDAKTIVIDVLAAFGHRDVVDLGDITTSRGTEMYLALWIRMMMALGTGMFNVKVVR
jgi:predicted dinucleotide-binding enzyme